jgi:hypothetical protein
LVLAEPRDNHCAISVIDICVVIVLRLFSSHYCANTLIKFLVAISLSFTGSPIHPPSRCSEALTHQNNRWGRLLSMGAPDSPVRQPRHPTVRVLTQSTVRALTSGSTGQSGATPDRHCSLSSAPLTSALTFVASCSAVRGTVQLNVAPKSRCSGVTPDSLVAHRTAQ